MVKEFRVIATACKTVSYSSLQCEKHSKKEEALAKLKEGVTFDEVAREFSEDKARQGVF